MCLIEIIEGSMDWGFFEEFAIEHSDCYGDGFGKAKFPFGIELSFGSLEKSVFAGSNHGLIEVLFFVGCDIGEFAEGISFFVFGKNTCIICEFDEEF